MRLTLYTDYSLRTLMYLGAQKEGRLATIKDISAAYNISKNHLMKVIYELGKAGYIETIRGRGGGIRLAKRPEEINIGTVVRQTEDDFQLVECFDGTTNTCIISPVCGLRHALNRALTAYLNVLDEYTLSDFLLNKDTLANILFDGGYDKILTGKDEKQEAKSMENVLVFGHKNPDTDTITSAIVYAHLKNQLGQNAEAVRLGEVNNETQFALDKFGFEAPRLIGNVAEEAKAVILVDHNERQQSADGIENVQVMEVIDHHRIANFETADPLYYRAEPVGCTATILNKLFKENGVEVPPNIAGLMLSAIISDSLLFKSPTCTDQDIAAARELAEIAGVDAEEYGLAMLKAGADLSDKSLEELLTLDAKEFSMGDAKVVIAQVNAVDVNDVMGRQAQLEELINAEIADKGLDLFFFVVTDILNNDSVALALGAKADKAGQAFNVQFDNHTALLKGVVSRKKQIVPVLTEAMK